MWLTCFHNEEKLLYFWAYNAVYTWLPQFLLGSLIEYIVHFSFEKFATILEYEVDAAALRYSLHTQGFIQ